MRRGANAPERLVEALADRYAFERTLGQGGMATVYLARDLRHDRPVAVKVLHPAISNAVGTERFLREIHTVAALQHPGIVPLFDSGEAAGHLYYVMPHVEGGSLRDRLRREKQLPMDESLAIAATVADALAFAHSRNVVHRDIKPENILFSDGRALVADFGLARSLTQPGGYSLTEEGSAVGTVAYMSPEQASGTQPVDARSDQYALACVLFEMLAGQPPFTGATQAAVLARHMTEKPPSLLIVRPGVPRRTDAAIRKALAKVPADRFRTVREFAAEAGGRAAAASRWLMPAAAAAAVALLVLAAVNFRGPRAGGAAPPGDLSRIAVLYFDDASRSDSLTWLAHGLTEDLIDALSVVDGLTVTTRNGVRQFAESAATPDSIARTLDVALIVDGSVQENGGDSIDVTVRLIDIRGVQLERLSVSHSAAEPLALRREVTSQLELALRRRIGRHVRLRQERDAAQNDVAWENVQRARALREDGFTLGRQRALEASMRAFTRADSLLATAQLAAPDWPAPTLERADLAVARALGGMSGPNPPVVGQPPADVLAEGLEYTADVLEEDPQNVRALTVRGELLFRMWEVLPGRPDSLLDLALLELEKATGRPRSLPRAWYLLSDVLLSKGRVAESRIAAERALREDVYAEQAAATFAQLFFSALYDNRAAADSICSLGRLRYPQHPNFMECELTLIGWYGTGDDDVRRARVLVARLDSMPRLADARISRRLLLAAVLARSGDGGEARAVLDAAHDLASEPMGASRFAEPAAYVTLLLGDTTGTIELLRTVVNSDPAAGTWLADHPWFRTISHVAAFRELVARR